MNLTSDELLAVGCAGVVTGLIGAAPGPGGGVSHVPVLVVGLDFPVHPAGATSIVAVIATYCAASSVNLGRGTVNMRLSMMRAVMTAFGWIASGRTAALLTPRVLEPLFAVAWIPTAVFMWRRARPNLERLACCPSWR